MVPADAPGDVGAEAAVLNVTTLYGHARVKRRLRLLETRFAANAARTANSVQAPQKTIDRVLVGTFAFQEPYVTPFVRHLIGQFTLPLTRLPKGLYREQ